MAEKLGALSSLDRGDFDRLSLGVQGQNNARNIFGLNFTPSTALTTGLGYATGLGAPMAIGTIIGNYQAEEAANKLLGNPSNFVKNIQQPSNPASSVQKVRSRADLDGDGIVTNFEMNRFGQTIPGLDLAPMYDYKQDDQGNPLYGMVSKNVARPFMESGKTMPADARANPYSSGRLSRQMQDDEFKSAMGSYALQDMADSGTGMKTTSDYAADAITQTNITNYDPTKGQYDPNFAKAVTRENQEAQGTDGDGTYICTALYDMGDMRAYIYKYDQLYGRKVNPNIYRGYCLWGKYVATKMKRQGWTYRIVKPIALAWAKQMAFDLSKGRHGKKNSVVKVISKIGEGVCYALGFVANLKIKKGVKYG